MRGFYILLLEVEDRIKVSVGGLGTHIFPKGYYVYTGSALGIGSTSLENRIRRHFSRQKKVRWHIDYLTSYTSFHIGAAYYAEVETRIECLVSKLLGRLGGNPFIRGFGSSDCDCKGHLTYFSSREILDSTLSKLERHLDKRGLKLRMLHTHV